jgi:hypothetical protein
VCKAIEQYILDGGDFSLETMPDGRITFTITEWEAFRAILEPDADRRDGRVPDGQVPDVRA